MRTCRALNYSSQVQEAPISLGKRARQSEERHSGQGTALAIGWVSSILVHGLILAGALWVVEEIRPVPPKVFRWNVTLVEKTRLLSVDAAIPSGSRSTARSTAEFKPPPAMANRPSATVERKVVPRRRPRRMSDTTTPVRAVQIPNPRPAVKATIGEGVEGATSKVAATTVTTMPVKTTSLLQPSTQRLSGKIDPFESTQRWVKGSLGTTPAPASIAKRTPRVSAESIGREPSMKRTLDQLVSRTRRHRVAPSVSSEATVVTTRVPSNGTGKGQPTVDQGLITKGNFAKNFRKVAKSAELARSDGTVFRSTKEGSLVPTRVGERPSPTLSGDSGVVTQSPVARDADPPQILARAATSSPSQPLRSEISQVHDTEATRGVIKSSAEGKEVDRKTSRVQGATSTPSSAGRLTARNKSATTTDYGWLTRAMRERLGEFMQYPDAARTNNWEGKVVLRVVIGENGDLADVSIQRSSGHKVLDQDAMNLVRRACPLPLDFPLGRPKVGMTVPITYSLR